MVSWYWLAVVAVISGILGWWLAIRSLGWALKSPCRRKALSDLLKQLDLAGIH